MKPSSGMLSLLQACCRCVHLFPVFLSGKWAPTFWMAGFNDVTTVGVAIAFHARRMEFVCTNHIISQADATFYQLAQVQALSKAPTDKPFYSLPCRVKSDFFYLNNTLNKHTFTVFHLLILISWKRKELETFLFNHNPFYYTALYIFSIVFILLIFYRLLVFWKDKAIVRGRIHHFRFSVKTACPLRLITCDSGISRFHFLSQKCWAHGILCSLAHLESSWRLISL